MKITLPTTNNLSFPNFSERIPEKILTIKIPKAFKEEVNPNRFSFTSKCSESTGINGPTILLAMPITTNWEKNKMKFL